MHVVRTVDALLSDLARRHPHERVRSAVEIARDLGPKRRRSLLTELAAAEPYCRHLAVTMAAATGDREQVAAALGDAHPSVRRHALAATDLPDEAIAAMVEDGAWADRNLLYSVVRRRRRHELADRLLPAVRRRWGDTEAARLLPACTEPTVAGALSTMAYAVVGWAALTARHPGAVVEHVHADLAALTTAARVDWWQRNGAIQRALARHQPAALLDLCERFLDGPLPSAVVGEVGRLLAVDPARVHRLVLADPARAAQLGQWSLSRSVRDRLASLSDDDLGALLRASGPVPRLVATVLKGLPPARREAVFDSAYGATDLAAQVLADEILAVLPHRRRHAEARRMLALPIVATEPATRLRIMSFLPYPDALAELDRASRSAEAEERARAYELLVRCAARTGDPAALTELLGRLDRVRNEQDPVRSRLLNALGQVRPDLFAPDAVDHLDRLVRDSLDARDSSWTTTAAVNRLVFGVLWQSVASDEARPLMLWALETIERISAWQQSSFTVYLRHVLRRGQEHDVFDRARGWLTEALRRNNPEPVLTLARSLGKRAWDMPGLQKLLGRATRLKQQWTVQGAVALWLAPPRQRTERAVALVERDESMLTLPEVLAVVARRRTDLVDRHLLRGRPLRGRFGTRKAVWVPAIDDGVLTLWTPDQVSRYATLVRAGVDDAGLDRWQRARLARILARLPGRAPASWADLAAGDDVLIAEGVLTGLGHHEPPEEALPVLVRHLDSDRARVVVFALSRCAQHMTPSRLAPYLATTLAEAPKVTVRKEIARMLSQLRVPGAVDELVAAWHREGQHRDVLVAVAGALRGWLDDPRSWAVLEAATAGERHAAEMVLGADPFGLAEADRRRYAGLVRRLTRHTEPEVVRRAYTALAVWAPWAPGSAEDITAGITDLTPGPTWGYAVRCAATPIVWSGYPDLLADATEALVRLAGTDPDAEPLRDRPARQRLGRLVDEVCAGPEAVRRDPAPVRRVVAILRAEPTFVAAAARLAASLAWPGPRLVSDLSDLADILTDAPWAVSSVDGILAVDRWEPDDVAPGVDALAGRGDPAGGRLAVALTRVAGPRAGWPDAWRERLRELRRHPAAEVRDAALLVFSASE